jgi:XTP/dITP diphosphohydrolase
MTLARLVLATSNAGKVRELRGLVAEWGRIDVLSLADVPPLEMPEETGVTYLDNALLKARAVAAASALPALADDSGIEVDALDGRPGVWSARYADGEAACNARLIEELRDVPAPLRTARYRAVVALAFPNGDVVSAEGRCEGSIGFLERGTGGFGYDPLFISSELGQVVGEISAESKARISHRARAMRALGAALQARGIVASPP